MSQFDADLYFNKIKARGIDTSLRGEQRIRALDTRSIEEKIAAIKAAKEEKLAALDGMTQRKAQETGLASFGAGANRTMEAFGTAYGLVTGDMENFAREQGESGAEYWEARKPQDQRDMEQLRSNAVEGADGEFNKAIAAVEGTIDNGLLGTFAAEQVPNLIPGGAVGRVAGVGAKVLGATAKVAGTAAVSTGVATGAVQQGADIGGGVYDDLLALDDTTWAEMPEFQKLSKLLGADKAKETIALTQGRKAGAAAGVASVLTNLLPAGATLERALAGATKPGLGILAGAAKGFVGEATQEALEEGLGGVAGNVAKQAVDTEVDTFEGVGEAAGLGALGGGLLGGPIGGAAQAGKFAKEAIDKGLKATEEKEAKQEKMSQAKESGDVSQLEPLEAATVLTQRVMDGDTEAAKKLDEVIKGQEEKVAGMKKALLADEKVAVDEAVAALEAAKIAHPDKAKKIDGLIAKEKAKLKNITDPAIKKAETDLAKMKALSVVPEEQEKKAFTPEVKAETITKAKEGDTAAAESIVKQVLLNPSAFDENDGLMDLADNGPFTEAQKTVLRSLSDAQSKINALKTTQLVNKEVLEGGNGNIGMAQYIKDIGTAVRRNLPKQAGELTSKLKSFQSDHRAKARSMNQAFSAVSAENPIQYVAKKEAGGWEVFSTRPEGWDRAKNGGLEIHKNSGGLIKAVMAENQAIAATVKTVDALQRVQESDTSTNNVQPEPVNTPEVAEGPAGPTPPPEENTTAKQPKKEKAEEPAVVEEAPAEDIPYDGPPPVDEDPGFDESYTPEDDGVEYDEDGNEIIDDRSVEDAKEMPAGNPDLIDAFKALTGEALDYAANPEDRASGAEQAIVAKFLQEFVDELEQGNTPEEALANMEKRHENDTHNTRRYGIYDALDEINDLLQEYNDNLANYKLKQKLEEDEQAKELEDAEPTGYLNLPVDTQEDVEPGPVTAEEFGSTNLVARYFRQRKLNKKSDPNGLLQFKDLMTTLWDKKGEVNKAVLAKILPGEVTDEQLNLLKTFWYYSMDGNNSALAKIWDNLNGRPKYVTGDKAGTELPVYENQTFQNFMEFLRPGEDQDYDQNLMTAIAYGAFTYVAENGGGPARAPEFVVREMLGLSKDDHIPIDAWNAVAYAGTNQSLVMQSLGQKIYQSLGFETINGAPESEVVRFQLALGAQALGLLQQQGFMELVKVDKKWFVGNEANLENNNEGAVEPYVPFVRIIKTKPDGETNTLVDSIVQANKGTQGILPKIFSNQEAKTPPRKRAKSKPQEKINKSKQKVPAKAAELSEKPNSEKWFVLPRMTALTDAISEQTLKKMAGWKDLSTMRIHKDQRIAYESTNDEIERDWSDWAEFAATNNGNFYFTNEMWQPQRNGLREKLVNPQTSKIHRFLMAKADWNSTFDVADLESKAHRNFLLAVAQGMGVKTDKQTREPSLEHMEELMAEDHVQAAIEILQNLKPGEKLSNEQEQSVTAAVGKHKLHGLMALSEYARYKATKGKFTTHLMYEVDGVSNGVALTHTLLGESTEDLGPTFGMIPENSPLTGFSGFRGLPGAKDIYEALALEIQEQLVKLGFDAAWTKPIYDFMGQLVDANGDVTSDTRDFAKYPLLMLMFGGSIPNNVKSMAGAFSEKILDKITETANNPDMLETERLDAIVEYIRVYNNILEQQGLSTEQLIAYPTSVDEALETSVMNFQKEAAANYFTETLGAAVTAAMESRFENLTTTRKELNTAAQIAFAQYNTARDYLIEQRLEQEMEAGNIKYREISDLDKETGKRGPKYKQPLQSLGAEAMAEIEAELAPIKPVMHTWLSQQDGNLEGGIDVSRQDSKMADSRNYTYSQKVGFGQQVPENAYGVDTEVSFFKHARGVVKSLGDPGVRAIVMAIHSTDSAISMLTAAQFPSLNMHDALGFSAENLIEGAKAFNQNTLKVLLEYSPALAIKDMLDRSFDNMAPLMTKHPELGHILGGIEIGAPGFEKNIQEVIADSDIALTAWTAEVKKLEFLASLKIMDQYSLDGGEYVLTADDKAAIQKKLKEAKKELSKLEPPPEEDQVEAAQVTPQNLSTVWGEVHANGGTNKHNPRLHEYLQGENPTTRGLLGEVATDLQLRIKMKSLTPVAETQAYLYLGMIQKLLDSGRADEITIRYISPETPKTDFDRKYAHILDTASAWYANNTGKGQISFLRPEFKHSLVGAETVVHEMLHGVLQDTLARYEGPDAKRPTNKEEAIQFDAVKELEQLLETLRDQTKGKYRQHHGLLDVHELVSVGMTNRKFQINVLKKADVSKLESKALARLKDGAKAFMDLLNRILFGSKATPVTSQGLDMLIQNVAIMLEHQNSRYKPIPREPMASTSAQDFTGQQVFDALAGGQESQAFSGHLRSLLDTIVTTIYGNSPAIQADAMRSAPATADEVYLEALANGETPFASKLTALLPMGDRAAYVAESVQLALQESLDASGPTLDEVRRIYKQAQKHIKVQDFYEGDWFQASQQERNSAQAQYDLIFTPDSGSAYLSQFMAAVLTYGPLHDAMQKLKVGGVEGSLRDNSVAEKVKVIFAKLMLTLSRLLTGVRQGDQATTALATLGRRMATIQKKRANALDRMKDRPAILQKSLAQQGSEKLRKAVGGAADYIAGNEGTNLYAKALAGLAGTVLNERTEGFMDFLYRVRDGMADQRYGLMASIINEMRGVRPITEEAHRLLDDMNAHEQTRKRTMDQTAEYIRKRFGRTLSRVELKSMTRVVMKTDMVSLMDDFSLPEMADLLADTKKLNKAIADYEAQLSGPFKAYYMTAGKALGLHMATGETAVGHLMLNATSIVYLAGTKHQGKVNEQGPDALKIMEPLISLYALKETSQNFKSVAHKVISEEMARGVSQEKENGFEATLKMHKMMQKDAAENLFAGDEYHMIKGYVKDILNPHIEMVAATEAQGLQLEKAGYVEVTSQTLSRDPADPSGEGRKLYIIRDKGLSGTVLGFMPNTNKKAKGSQIHSGVTSVLTDDYNRKNASVNAKIAKDKAAEIDKMFRGFDPTQVPQKQRNHMVPVLNGSGQAINYRYVMTEETKDKLLGSDGRLDKVMGAMAGNTLDKKATPAHSQRGIDALRAQYEESYAKEPQAFITVSLDSLDPEVRERYRMLPDETRAYIKEVWGSDQMLVRKDTYDLAFGYRKYSLYEAFEKPPTDRTFMEAMMVNLIGTIKVPQPDGTFREIGNKRALFILKAENIWQELVTEIKDIVVIKNFWTFLGNEMSNLTLLSLAGVPIQDIVKHKITAYQSTLAFQKAAREKNEILFQLDSGYLGSADEKSLRNRVVELDDQMERSPIKPLIDAGMFQTLVEDIAAEEDQYSYKSKLTRTVDKYTGAESTNAMVVGARSVAKFGLMTHDSTLYKVMNQGTILGDFTSRYVLYTHLMNRKPKMGKDGKPEIMTSEKALLRARSAFVNYDVPTHRGIQYLNDTGLLWFSKYYLRIQGVIYDLVRENPLGALALLGLDHLVGGFSDILDSSMWGKSPVNLGMGALQFPGTLDELLTVQMVGL